MPTPHPTAFYPELTDDRLSVIAVALLDVRYTTIRAMNSPHDDNYTRETAVFGRSKNMLIDMAQSGAYEWMSLKHGGMDVTFNIGGVPCRFFSDDPNNPEKSGFFRRNAVDDLFAPDDQQPVMWRFVVGKALTEHDEDQVYLVGYNVYQEKICEWQYRAVTPILYAVDQLTPASANIPPADVGLRNNTSDKDGQSQANQDKTA